MAPTAKLGCCHCRKARGPNSAAPCNFQGSHIGQWSARVPRNRQLSGLRLTYAAHCLRTVSYLPGRLSGEQERMTIGRATHVHFRPPAASQCPEIAPVPSDRHRSQSHSGEPVHFEATRRTPRRRRRRAALGRPSPSGSVRNNFGEEFEASLSFRRLISLSQCSLERASGPSNRCSGLRPVCWPRGRLGK